MRSSLAAARMRSAVSPPIQPSKRSRGFRSGSKKLSLRPGRPKDVPAVGRALGVVDDEDAGGAELGRLLVLVGPAAVVGHVLAVEDAARAVSRLVDLDEQDLAREVHALEVVPLPFGRLDEVAAVDELARRFRPGRPPARSGGRTRPRAPGASETPGPAISSDACGIGPRALQRERLAVARRRTRARGPSSGR
ncbi:MAG: hypothetical protein MZV64_64145 [Ignavibacteriales bacterium]|nr:hypothetical protein [Ignavibacteriales bacterium]